MPANQAKLCPVCQWELKEEIREVIVQGRKVQVCCDECAAKVREEPAKYAVA